MHHMPFVLAAALLALTACAPSTRFDEDVPVNISATCNAADFQYLVGEPIGVTDTLGTPLRVRVLGAEDFVPRDFDPSRLTFTTSPEGEVSRIFCG